MAKSGATDLPSVTAMSQPSCSTNYGPTYYEHLPSVTAMSQPSCCRIISARKARRASAPSWPYSAARA